MVRRVFISLLLMWVALQGCTPGDEVVVSFEPGQFRKIEFDDSFEVRFHRSSEFKVVARGNERFIEGLRTVYAGDSLLIENTVRAAWLNPEDNKVVLDVYSDSLREIRANESCHLISIDTLRSSNLTLIVGSKLNTCDLVVDCSLFGYYNVFPCGGIMKLSGRTNHMNIWNDALMEVHAFGLKTNTAYVENSGGGSCRIHVEQDLSYSILDRGDIYLQGSPPLIQALEVEGEGSLILVD